jgi:TfoX/Sxy family transcriptional regulator of competence genes
MQWKKTPPELVATFDKAAPDDPRVTRKPMFGYPALFVNGNMFASTFQDKVVVRLGESDRAELERRGAAQFEPMAGRPMREYVVVPPAIVAKPAELRAWVDRARSHAAGLPPKAATKKATAKKAAASTTRGKRSAPAPVNKSAAKNATAVTNKTAAKTAKMTAPKAAKTARKKTT